MYDVTKELVVNARKIVQNSGRKCANPFFGEAQEIGRCEALASPAEKADDREESGSGLMRRGLVNGIACSLPRVRKLLPLKAMNSAR